MQLSVCCIACYSKFGLKKQVLVFPVACSNCDLIFLTSCLKKKQAAKHCCYKWPLCCILSEPMWPNNLLSVVWPYSALASQYSFICIKPQVQYAVLRSEWQGQSVLRKVCSWELIASCLAILGRRSLCRREHFRQMNVDDVARGLN